MPEERLIIKIPRWNHWIYPFMVGAILFFYGMHGRHSLDRQAVSHAIASLNVYIKAHATNLQEAKINEFFQQEQAAWLAERRFQRVGLEVASLGGLALQLFSIFILRHRRQWN